MDTWPNEKRITSIFISYRQGQWQTEIRCFADELDVILGRGSVFIDKAISTSERWDQRIPRNLQAAEFALFFLEPDFWRSQNCVSEVVEILGRIDRGEDVTVIPVILASIDSADLSPDCQRMYLELRRYQFLDARDGFDNPTVSQRVIEGVQTVIQEGQPTHILAQEAISQLVALLGATFSIDEIANLLHENRHLRKLIRHVTWDNSKEHLIAHLGDHLLSDPLTGLRLLYAVHKQRPHRTDVAPVLEVWRKYETTFFTGRPPDPENQLQNVLMRLPGSIELPVGFPMLPQVPSSSALRRSFVQSRFLASRKLVTLPLLDCLSRQVGPDLQLSISYLRRAYPVPKRRSSLANLLLDLSGDDSQVLRSRLKSAHGEAHLHLRISCSPWELARSFVEHAELANLITSDFFARLLLFANGRISDVHRIANEWGVAASDPTGRFWDDRLTLLVNEHLTDFDLRYLLLNDWGFPRGLIHEHGASTEYMIRHVLTDCRSHGVSLRPLLALIETKYPSSVPAVRAVEFAMLSEEPARSALLSPSEGGRWPRECGRLHALPALLVDLLDGRSLRRLVHHLSSDTSWLPAPPVRLAELAYRALDGLRARGEIQELIDALLREFPIQQKRIDRVWSANQGRWQAGINDQALASHT